GAVHQAPPDPHASRPRVGGAARGRSGLPLAGPQPCVGQTLGLHARRFHRRPGRGVLRQLSGLRQSLVVHLLRVGPDPCHRSARRHGLDGRCGDRCVRAHSGAGAAAQFCRLPGAAVWHAHGGDDDLATAWADSDQPAWFRSAQGSSAMSDDYILSVEHLMMRFGGIKALNDVSLNIQRGSISALIGPNGAGKTTVFNCLTGFYKATCGRIQLNARGSQTDVIQVLGEPFRLSDFVSPRQLGSRLWYKLFGGTHLVNRAGLARTFQNIRLFREMSVVENLLVAQHMWLNRGLLAGVFQTPRFRQSEEDALNHAFYWLEVVDLVDCANRLAGELSYGQQRRLEIARALCTRPQLICLDEPAAGLNPPETVALSRIIRTLRDEHDLTVLLIEHDMGMVMSISDYIVVL